MTDASKYNVTVKTVAARPIAAVQARVSLGNVSATQSLASA